MADNVLYYGDNLDVLRRHVADESVDLIYLDPPFNSNADYNVLFADKGGERAHAQIQAFEDTWQWDTEAARNFEEAIQHGGERVAECMIAFKALVGKSDMLAYLSMMAPRLVELRRAMKPTASIYLHCDSTASHYLKLLMDSVFDARNFRNDIVWKRRVGSSSAVHSANRYGDVTDNILFYAKSSAAPFQVQYSMDAKGYDEYLAERFKFVDENGRRFRTDNLANPAPRPNLMYDYKGYKHPKNGWAISREKMELWDKDGRLYFPKKPTGRIARKRFLDEVKGKPVQNLWDDIAEINSQAQERLGYPTQKPESLLERVINASSFEGDTILDPFCGCGTTIAAAQKLKRRWIGIDITHLAIKLIKGRLADAFGERVSSAYEVVGEPTDLDGARALAAEPDKYQFQYWALGLVHPQARPEPGQQKKGADKGIDGRLYIGDGKGGHASILISVKSGHVTVNQVRDLRGVIERDGAAIGVFVCIEEPTAPMRAEAADAGFYQSKGIGETKHPRLQILTIEDVFAGKRIDMPAQTEVRSFKQAPKVKGKKTVQTDLPFSEDA